MTAKARVLRHGAQFLARSYACRAGSRQYKLYIPADRVDGPQGLVVMLHGCTQSPDDFAVGTGMNAVAEARLLVAYPAQTSIHNGGCCWNWFRPGDQRRDSGEPAIIAGITRALIAEFAIDPSRVYVAGLSAGGAMAAVMGEAYPELYAAIGVHSGLPYGSASDVVSAFATMRDEPGWGHPMPRLTAGGKAVRTIVFHGSADQTVHPANADRIIAAVRAPTEAGEVRRVEGRSPSGRIYTRTIALTPPRCCRSGALADRRRRACLVRGSGGRFLHRSGRSRRLGRDGPLLPERFIARALAMTSQPLI